MNLFTKTCTTLLVSLLPSFLIVACAKDHASTNMQSEPSDTRADNTKRNERDRAHSVTPMDQGNDPADLRTTQAIRKALVADDSLSFDAKNAKVITANGVVVLRGPVKSAAEREKLQAKAQELAGSNRVENLLDVITNN